MKEESLKIEKVYEAQEKLEKRKFFRKMVDIKLKLIDEEAKVSEV